MTCERMAGMLDAYVDGELDSVHAREIEWHLGECAACKRQLATRRGCCRGRCRNICRGIGRLRGSGRRIMAPTIRGTGAMLGWRWRLVSQWWLADWAGWSHWNHATQAAEIWEMHRYWRGWPAITFARCRESIWWMWCRQTGIQ